MKLLEALNYSCLLAHDGHGHGVVGSGHTLSHYLSEPLHAPLWIACLLAVVLTAGMIRQRYKLKTKLRSGASEMHQA